MLEKPAMKAYPAATGVARVNVPRDPTPDMIRAGLGAIVDERKLPATVLAAVWRAMHAAATKG